MASRKALTGGTDDTNPQWLQHVFTFTTPAALGTVGANDTVNLPVYPVGTGSREKATIVEIVAVEIMADGSVFQGGGPANNLTKLSMKLGSQTTPAAGESFQEFMSDANAVFLDDRIYGMGTPAAAWSGGMDPRMTSWRIDLTDKAGHGILWASQTINFAARMAQAGVVFWTGATPFVVSWRLRYRFKTVGLTEYIGIVQSQTSSA